MSFYLPEIAVLVIEVLGRGVLPQDGGQLTPVLPHKPRKVLQVLPVRQVRGLAFTVLFRRVVDSMQTRCRPGQLAHTSLCPSAHRDGSWSSYLTLMPANETDDSFAVLAEQNLLTVID